MAMIENPAIKSLHIQNLLSFGPDSPPITLGPLNVLIGPNGSGKSNLIEVIGLLQSTPKDLAVPIREGGGIVEWLWKRPRHQLSYDRPRRASAERIARSMPTATIAVSANPVHVRGSIRYRLAFTGVNYQLDVRDECVEAENPPRRPRDTPVYFGYVNGRPMLKMNGSQRELPRDQVNPQQSILSQRKDPAQYPELTYLGQLFGGIKIYRNWEFGPISDVRNLFGPEQSTEFLDEDISNLGLMLNSLNSDSDPETKSELLKYLKLFYDGAEAVETPIHKALVDVRLIERGGVSISAVRLSDGTLRWLALLTILLHPSPPPLVCIEEPELGLHPDIIPPLAQLLREASRRMQLIITTHSDALVSELTDIPETVIVCEKENGSTVLKRLERKKLSAWLKTYSLGHLWRKGEIGGNRW
jgi:predicted ATPase